MESTIFPAPRGSSIGWLAGLIVLATFLFGCFCSSYQPLANDELLTFYTLHQPTLAQMVHFQSTTPIVLEPPAFEIFAYASGHFFHNAPLSLRIVSLLGFALAQLCLYFLLKPVIGERGAVLAAFLLILLPVFNNYAWLLRPYALLMGLSIAALLCWQHAAYGQQHRKLFIAGMIAALALAITCQFYGVFALLALLAAEAHRTLRRRALGLRAIDRRMLIALFASACAVFAVIPFSWAALPFQKNYQRGPGLGARSIIEAYTGLLLPHLRLTALLSHGLHAYGRAAVLLLLFLAVFYFSYRRMRSLKNGELLPLWTALAVLALIPFFCVFLAYNFTHLFAPRHCIACVPGFTALCVIALSAPLNRVRPRALAVTGSIILLLAVLHCRRNALALQQQELESQRAMQISPDLAAWLQTHPDQDLYATADVCLAFSLHGDAALFPRIHCLYSRDRELEYVHQESLYLTEQNLARHTDFPLQFVSYEDFHSHLPALLIYREYAWEDWIPESLRDDGDSMQRLDSNGQLGGDLYGVTGPNDFIH